jgi:hypothetical protein
MLQTNPRGGLITGHHPSQFLKGERCLFFRLICPNSVPKETDFFCFAQTGKPGRPSGNKFFVGDEIRFSQRKIFHIPAKIPGQTAASDLCVERNSPRITLWANVIVGERDKFGTGKGTAKEGMERRFALDNAMFDTIDEIGQAGGEHQFCADAFFGIG